MTTPTTRRAPLPSGVDLAYTDSGGDGPLVVLAHGFLLDKRMFAEQVAGLAPAYRVVAWDERGHGETEWDGQPFTYWDSARDLLGLLDHLGAESAVVGGMSQGGFLALRAALVAPERVRGLILIDTQAGLENPDAAPLYEAMHQQWLAQGLDDDLAAAAFGIIASPDRAVWDEYAVSAGALPAESLNAPFRALMDRDDVTGRLGEITAPAVVIHGTEDTAIPLERAEVLAAGLPGSGPVRVVDGAAHASNVTHPAEVNAAIGEFLAGLPG